MALNTLNNNEMALQLVHSRPVLKDSMDLIVIILLCLPVKTLGRFKAVCKSWNAVIRTKSFIEKHLSVSKERAVHAVYYSYILRPTIEHPLSINSIIAAWNGLVFECTYYSGSVVISELSIYNPETKERFYLPDDSGCLYEAEAEPRYGVAYGPRCYDYKVYKFAPPSFLIDVYECLMYSSVTGCWTSLGTPPGYPLYNLHVCINGTVYWQICKGRVDYPGSILTVDEVGNFRTFDTPELGSGCPYLIKLGNSLGLIVILKVAMCIDLMSIWVLENSLPTWSKVWETGIPLFPLELTVSATAWGNRLVITTPSRFLTYCLVKKNWDIHMSSRLVDNVRSTFSGFITPSLLPCKLTPFLFIVISLSSTEASRW